MAKKVKFQPNHSNIRAFLRGQGIAGMQLRAMVQKTTDEVTTRAGRSEGFGGQVNVGRDRIRGTVMAETAAAKRSQAKNHDLERAVGGGV